MLIFLTCYQLFLCTKQFAVRYEVIEVLLRIRKGPAQEEHKKLTDNEVCAITYYTANLESKGVTSIYFEVNTLLRERKTKKLLEAHFLNVPSSLDSAEQRYKIFVPDGQKHEL